MSNAVISISDVDIAYNDHLVLSNVNLSINAGELVYFIGKTGSGKSSILKMLYSAIGLEKGNAIVSGIDLNSIKRKEIPMLRRKLGIVFQDFQLLIDRSIYKNLEFVLKATDWKNKKEIKAQALEVLDSVGLKNKEYKMPHELSGGEQQRVVIARALINNPEVILADEPTGNLDPSVTDNIMQILTKCHTEGMAVVIATHNYHIIRKYPGTVYQVKDGKVSKIEISELNSIE